MDQAKLNDLSKAVAEAHKAKEQAAVRQTRTRQESDDAQTALIQAHEALSKASHELSAYITSPQATADDAGAGEDAAEQEDIDRNADLG